LKWQNELEESLTLIAHRLRSTGTTLLLAAALFFVPCANAQNSYQPTQANLQARSWYQDAKFGMFIHWGIYSELGAGEWVMEEHRIPVSDYEKLAPQFYPVRFDPKQWVALAKAAGMKYITVTSRHHDGFAMFDTKQSDWNIVQRTPYGKDVMRMLADECHRQGIKLFFYYSQLDWHHRDYYPLGGTGHAAGRPKGGDWNRYLDFMNGQLTELLSNYGEIGGIWFDGMWDKPDADWKLDRTYSLIHNLQPQALIVANHHQKPKPGEDVQTFERDLPGENTAGFSGAAIGELPLETSDTVNRSWGFNLRDNDFKSAREIVHYLVRAAGKNANLLLNVGPMPNGEIPEEAARRLREAGQWLGRNGESIYGTRGGPFAPQSWGVSTQKANQIYLHVLQAPGPSLALAKPAKSIRSAYLLKDHSPVQFTENEFGLLVKLPSRAQDEWDQIIVLEPR
jgi:alpha-L-fucosidase